MKKPLFEYSRRDGDRLLSLLAAFFGIIWPQLVLGSYSREIPRRDLLLRRLRRRRNN